MLRKSVIYIPKFRSSLSHNRTCQNTNNLPKQTNGFFSFFDSNEITFKPKYFFARRTAQINKPVQQTEPHQQQQTPKQQLPKNQQKKKEPHYKPTQNYTFSNLDQDLQMYQEYLTLFNTHTKKAHDKLLRNQLKLIQCLIQSKRQDLLNKFLSTNYRNRLANPQTLTFISNYFVTKIHDNINQIISSSAECQSLLESITLLAEFNELQAFQTFLEQLTKKSDSNSQNQNQNYLVNILKALPSPQSQFLTLYNFLIKEKELPEYLIQSQFFGIHTENMKFHNLGQTFFQIRKFMRRYFANYSKTLQNEEGLNDVKTFERQYLKISKGSTLQTDVFCFLKALNYQNIRNQIQIDGFVVDFVIEGVISREKGFLKNEGSAKEGLDTTILQVMGSYHYTSKGKLKGRDVRKLILLGSKYRQKKYRVRIIHYDDLNKTRGFRNKLELIKSLLQQSGREINWEPQNKGLNSNWQLKQHYEEFK